jgi:hypothetical protein
MKKIIVVIVLNLFCLFYISSLIQAEDKTIKPLLALVVEQGGTSVGDLNPEFILYDNGFIIYGNPYEEYYSTKLKITDKNNFIKSLNINKLLNLKNDYELNACSDCPTYHLCFLDQNPIKIISAYGIIGEDRFPPHGPSDLVNILNILSSYKAQPKRIWVPEKIEVEIIGFYNTNKRMPWPKNWPVLKSSEWQKEKHGGYKRLFNRKDLKQLKEIEKKQQNEIAILHENELLGMNYHYVFPNEKEWITEIRKYNMSYYNDEINVLSDKMEADAKKKHIPTPTDKFFYYRKAQKEYKKEMGLKYKTD